MNIYAESGDKVVYTGASEDQISYVGATDPRSLLVEGQVYTIDHTDVHSYFTYVYLEEVDGEFNSCMFKDFKEVRPLTIKDHVTGQVHFSFYRNNELWYKTDTGLEFPVPIDDTGEGIFLAKDKAIMFMRYIRKHLANIEKGKQECQATSSEPGNN